MMEIRTTEQSVFTSRMRKRTKWIAASVYLREIGPPITVRVCHGRVGAVHIRFLVIGKPVSVSIGDLVAGFSDG